MGYVQRVLLPGEQVRHISSIHWIVYWPGVAVAALAVVAYWIGDTRRLPGFWQYTAYVLAVVAVVLLIQQWFQWGHRNRSHEPTCYLQEGSHPAGDQRNEHG